jgi:hypothetical protein
MNPSAIKCPQCGYEIPISEVLSTQIMREREASLRAEHEARRERAVAAAEQRARGSSAAGRPCTGHSGASSAASWQ